MNAIRFGVLAEPQQITQAALAGYDYIELDLNRVLSLDETAYRAMTSEMERFGIYAEVVCGILPEGTHVNQGMKSGDVDPRCRPEHCLCASDKALSVGGGVLEALLHFGYRE